MRRRNRKTRGILKAVPGQIEEVLEDNWIKIIRDRACYNGANAEHILIILKRKGCTYPEEKLMEEIQSIIKDYQISEETYNGRWPY